MRFRSSAPRPTVSVVMSVYNDACFLRESVLSILNQTYSEFEFIIIDDGSTDDTPRVLGSFQDSRLRVVRQENRGLAAALNHGLSLAQGEYIARQDADDVSMAERLSQQVRFLDGTPDVALVGSAAVGVNASGKRIRIYRFPEGHEQLREWLTERRSCFVHSSLMYRREAALSCGGYDEHYRMAEDYDFLLRISEQFEVANLPLALVQLRIREDSMQGRCRERGEYPLFARYVASLRERRHAQASRPEWVWGVLFPRFRQWYSSSSVRRQSRGAAWFRKGAIAWQHGHLLACGVALSRAVLLHPGVLGRRRGVPWSDRIQSTMDSAILAVTSESPVEGRV